MPICHHNAPNGEKSILFQQLETKYGAGIAHDVWTAIRSQQFLNKHGDWLNSTDHGFILDDNGEPVFQFIRDNPDFKDMLDFEDESNGIESEQSIAVPEKVNPSIIIESPVIGVELIRNSGLTVKEANQFIDLLIPQIEKQAYVENRAKTANAMFSFGNRWARIIPGEWELSEQGEKLGTPRSGRINIKSKGDQTYGYFKTDQNNNPLPGIDKLEPIKKFIQDKLGIDLTHYDSMLGNIYDNTSFIHQHRDITEDISSEKYPVIVINLGADGQLVYDENPNSDYASYNTTGSLKLSNGSIYAFGINGINRFRFHHRIASGLDSKNPLKPIRIPQWVRGGGTIQRCYC
jgi:alkylated DNA repair dioxygenase AlkB